MTEKGRTRGSALLIGVLLSAAIPAQASKKKKAPPPESTPAPAATPKPEPKLDAPPEVPEGPPLVVLALALGEGHDRDVAQAGYVAEEAIRRAKHQQLMPLDDVLDPTAAQARKKATVEGLRQLMAAHNAYDQLDMEVGSELANKAIANLTKGNLIRTFPKVVDAYELRVAAFASDPKTLDQAKAELGNLLPIDPRGELSPNLFNPDVIALAEGLRQKVKAASTLTLKVSATPAAARVFVDGSFRGVTPLDVTNLAPGNHYVTLIAPGFHQVLKRVNPGPDPQLAVALEPAERADDLKSLSAAVGAAFHGPHLESALGQVATALAVEQALAVIVEAPKGQGARVYAERATAQPPALLDDLDHALPAASADQAKVIDALVTDAATRDHALASQRIAPVAAATASSSGGGVRYVGFAVLGVGAVAAGLGTVFGLGANSDVSDYKANPQLNTLRSTSLSNDGKSKALLASVSFGAAVVAAGAGALMVAFGGKHAAAAPASAPSPADSGQGQSSSAAHPHPAAAPPASPPPSTKPSSGASGNSSAAPPPPPDKPKDDKPKDDKPKAKDASSPTNGNAPTKDLGEDIKD